VRIDDERVNEKLNRISPMQAAVHANEYVFLFRGCGIRSFLGEPLQVVLWLRRGALQD
jgi:hypothetical protein